MKIKELFSDESKWIQGYSALDVKGRPVSRLDRSACKYCLSAAAWICYTNHCELLNVYQKIENYLKNIGYTGLTHNSIVVFNDNSKTTFNDIQLLVNTLDI